MIDAVRTDGSDQVGVGLLTRTSRGCYVVTAGHVLRGEGAKLEPSSVTVRSKYDESVTVTGSGPHDRDSDLAIFKIPNDFSSCATWTSTIPNTRGQEYYFIGKGGDWYIPTTPGRFNSVTSTGLLFDSIEVTPGMSGAPVFGDTGIAGLIINAYGTSSALVAPIGKAVKLLLSTNDTLENDIRRVADLESATAYGEALAKREHQEWVSDDPVPEGIDRGLWEGATNFLGATLLYRGSVIPSESEPPTYVILWNTEGRTGGNHDEQYLSIVEPDGAQYPPKPNVTFYVGGRGMGHIDYEPVEATSDEPIVTFAGCVSGEQDAMSECSVAASYHFKYCPDNRKYRYINLGVASKSSNDDDSYVWSKPFIDEKLGVELEFVPDSGFKISGNPSAAMLNAGFEPNSEINPPRVAKITNSTIAGKYKLAIGDAIASVNKRALDAGHDVECQLSEALEDNESTKVAVIRQGTNKIEYLDVVKDP
jgi:hypothetical protein